MAARKKSKKATKSKRARNKKARNARTRQKRTSKKVSVRKKGRTSSTKKKRTGRPSSPKAARVYTHKEGVTFEPEAEGSRAGGQSGDQQGLSDVQGADSESVDELLEEGNAFEADVVAGVERADDHEEREVRTHEVPEDDVPEEYRDKDS